MSKNGVTLKTRLLNVIETGAIRKRGCGFIFAFYSNCGHICSRLLDIQCKIWRDLENQVRGRSRSLKMATFDRPHATFYWSAIVNIALSCTIFEIFDVNNIVTLKSGLEVTQVIEIGAIQKLRYGFLFAFYSNYDRICSRF